MLNDSVGLTRKFIDEQFPEGRRINSTKDLTLPYVWIDSLSSVASLGHVFLILSGMALCVK